MPHKSSRSRTVVKIPFKTLFQPLASDASGFAGTYLDLELPNLGNRLSTFTNYFRRWRFSKALHVSQWTDMAGIALQYYNTSSSANNTAGVGISHAVGFYGAPEATVGAIPTSLDMIVQQVTSSVGSGMNRLELVIPRRVLSSALIEPWAMTSGGATPTDSSVCGNLQFGVQLNAAAPFYAGGSGLTVGVWCLISGEVEFADPIEASAQPLSLKVVDCEEKTALASEPTTIAVSTSASDCPKVLCYRPVPRRVGGAAVMVHHS